MNSQQPVRRIAIVGTGTIGASWATHYLARGFDVTATDPAPGAEAALRSYVDGAWEGVKTLGLAPGASPDRLKFTSDMAAALTDADFVQENAPERPELKVKQVLRETQGLSDAEAFARQSETAHSLLDTEDAHEGALAFAEKRAPVWRGR